MVKQQNAAVLTQTFGKTITPVYAMQRWFSGENWVQKMPVFLLAHRVAHQPTR